MSGPRAVAVVRRGEEVLVIRRHRVGAEPPDYVVLPGGSVEPGETFEEAAVRELAEEATMTARVERLVLDGRHDDREARYFLMADVVGEPVLGGPELEDHGPDNHFALDWVRIDDLADLELHPVHLRVDLPRVLA